MPASAPASSGSDVVRFRPSPNWARANGHRPEPEHRYRRQTPAMCISSGQTSKVFPATISATNVRSYRFRPGAANVPVPAWRIQAARKRLTLHAIPAQSAAKQRQWSPPQTQRACRRAAVLGRPAACAANRQRAGISRINARRPRESKPLWAAPSPCRRQPLSPAEARVKFQIRTKGALRRRRQIPIPLPTPSQAGLACPGLFARRGTPGRRYI